VGMIVQLTTHDLSEGLLSANSRLSEVLGIGASIDQPPKIRISVSKIQLS